MARTSRISRTSAKRDGDSVEVEPVDCWSCWELGGFQCVVFWREVWRMIQHVLFSSLGGGRVRKIQGVQLYLVE